MFNSIIKTSPDHVHARTSSAVAVAVGGTPSCAQVPLDWRHAEGRWAHAVAAYIVVASEAGKTIYRRTGSSQTHRPRLGSLRPDCVRSVVRAWCC